jgi:urea carboxylase-associated protein 2
MKQIFSKILKSGEKWSAIIGKGKNLHFTSLSDNANVSLLMYNSKDLSERYNMPDTLKAQHTAFLTAGDILMSDNGRAMASIIKDSTGWIDAISGCCDKSFVEKQYGKTSYQKDRNNYYRNGYDNFSIELIRNGLGSRDIVANINLFSKVYCDKEGNMMYAQNHSKTDDFIMIRTEMSVLLILSNTPNPLDNRAEYPSASVKLEVYEAECVKIDDICLNKCPQNKRAFENTWKYYDLMRDGN